MNICSMRYKGVARQAPPTVGLLAGLGEVASKSESDKHNCGDQQDEARRDEREKELGHIGQSGGVAFVAK